MSVIAIILLFGIAQGIFLAILIFHKHASLKANRFLGALMAVYAISLFHVYLGDTDFYITYPRVMFILLGVIFLLGPIHFLYAKYLINPSKKYELKDWVHLLPFTLYLLVISPELFKEQTIIDIVEKEYTEESPPLQFYILNWLFVIQLLCYMTAVLLLLKRHLTKMKSIFSNLDKVKLIWLRNITYMAGFVSVIFLIENILVLNQSWNTDYLFSSIFTGVYVYAMGYMGISKSEVFGKEITSAGLGPDEKKKVEKYKRSGLSKEKADTYMKQLVTLMEEEKLYCNSTLTLKDLSYRLSISTHYISETLNSSLQQNFFDFVNQYRVNHVIKDMGNDKKEHLTLLGIALDAGFNSKSSFNTIFKNQTGYTPSEYRKKIKLKVDPQ